MRFAPILGLIMASAAFAQDAKQDPAASYQMKPFRALDERLGGSWLAHWNTATNTPDSIYGSGSPIADWRENSLEEARRHALQVLEDNRDLLQLGTSEFREIIGARMGRTWSFVFDQYFRGLPCIDGRADVRINMKGVVAKLGSTAWPIPEDFAVVPTVDELEAQATAWLALGERRTNVKQPRELANRLVIWGDVLAKEQAPFHLAWEIPISNVDANGQGPIGRYYIDAHTAAVLHFATDKHDCNNPACTNAAHVAKRSPAAITPTTVTIMAWTRDGQSATAALNNIPLAGLQVNVPGIGIRTTDANGQFTIDITAPVTITVGNLDGTHNAPIQGANAPSASVVVTPGVPATLQLLNPAATPEEAAHTSTQFWIHTANEWVRTIVGNVAAMNTADAVVPTVNLVSINPQTGAQAFCNAYYTGNTVNFYPTGGGCNNTGFSTVVVHEWGHGIDDRFGGISNATGDGLSEGWGDIFGMFHPLVDNPIVGINFTQTGGSVRTGLNTRLYGTQTEVHAAGEVWMGFAWRLRENLRAAFGTPAAIAISNDIVISSVVADATNQATAVQEVFIADDDDGNLFNGVPHYAQLSAAAITKGMPYPQITPLTLQHAPLADTPNRRVPRIVNALVIPNDAGTVTQVRLVYSVLGGAAQTRIMVPNGATNGWRALLPGVDSGAITYHVEATSTTGTARLPATGENRYSTIVATTGPFVPFFTENFEGTATGWTHTRQSGTATDDWQLGTPNGKSGVGGAGFNVPWSDPAAAASSRVYGTDLGAGTANGAYPNNMNYYLRTPVINCAGRTGVTLRFRRWLSVEESQFDHAQINVNGSLVWENPAVGNLIDSSWQTFEYRLEAADNNPSVQVEFRLISDGGLALGGWNIDDVEIGTRTLPVLPATIAVTPEQASAGTPCNALITTDDPLELFVVVIGDAAGSTTISPFPTVAVGGTIDFIVGFTDAAGNYALSFPAISGAPAIGLLLYTQVLVFEGDGSYTLSNQNLSLFTP